MAQPCLEHVYVIEHVYTDGNNLITAFRGGENFEYFLYVQVMGLTLQGFCKAFSKNVFNYDLLLNILNYLDILIDHLGQDWA